MSAFMLTFCLAVALATPPQAKPHSLAFKAVTGAFFALSVPNPAESVQWYSDKLGLAVIFQASSGGTEVAVLEGGGLTVELIRDPAAQPGPARPELLHGVYKAGFLVKHLDATVEELRARGVTIAFGPFPATDQQRANVLIRDNAGNLIQIFGE